MCPDSSHEPSHNEGEQMVRGHGLPTDLTIHIPEGRIKLKTYDSLVESKLIMW